MNILKKAYCRTFQTVFKLAIPVLPYTNPKILSETEQIPTVLKKKKISSVLIVTDASLNALGMLNTLYRTLESSHIHYVVFDETVPNPTVKNVEDARSLYLKYNCEGLIGFGGGSSIDCAKAVGARIACPKKSIPQMKGILKVHKTTPYLIAVPTTAGTGSETTLATVITDEKTRHKFPINDFPLIPDCAVLDANNTKSLPPYLTAITGMDALTHAVEAYIGRSTTKSTRRDAIAATRMIFENLENCYHNGNNMDARKAMLDASFYAGRAFSKSYVGYCHAVAHTLGGKYNTSHGLANAVLLPYVLKAYGKSAHKKLAELAYITGLIDRGTSHNNAANAFIAKIEEMNRTMGIPTKLSDIQKEDIPILAKQAEKEGNPLYPVPRLMSAAKLEQFYYDVKE